MNEESTRPRIGRTLLGLIAVGIIAGLSTVVALLVLLDVREKQREALQPFFRTVALDEDSVDPALWSRDFPLQYQSYLRTAEMAKTRFGGCESIPRMPTDADPRTQVAQSKIEEDPRLVILWAGYPFSVDYREKRGHAYMLEDQTFTQRKKPSGACVNCHASVWSAYRKLGNGDVNAGFDALCALPFTEARSHVEHPVSCIDCHDPQTMRLRVTRPAFAAGIARLKQSQGIDNYDVHTMATHQEMRSFVCAQCHVEYYFDTKSRLVFPWDKGLRVEDMLDYYDDIGHVDWTHAQTNTPMLKAQHPEFETWSLGAHAAAGVACADCHMPYQRVGAMKVSDHQVRSPLLNVAGACQTCHRVPESELLARVHVSQERTAQTRDMALDALVEFIADLRTQTQEGKESEELTQARRHHRRAQFIVDMVLSENSTGFHASQETMRRLAVALDEIRKGQRQLAGPAEQPVAENSPPSPAAPPTP